MHFFHSLVNLPRQFSPSVADFLVSVGFGWRRIFDWDLLFLQRNRNLLVDSSSVPARDTTKLGSLSRARLCVVSSRVSRITSFRQFRTQCKLLARLTCAVGVRGGVVVAEVLAAEGGAVGRVGRGAVVGGATRRRGGRRAARAPGVSYSRAGGGSAT